VTAFSYPSAYTSTRENPILLYTSSLKKESFLAEPPRVAIMGIKHYVTSEVYIALQNSNIGVKKNVNLKRKDELTENGRGLA